MAISILHATSTAVADDGVSPVGSNEWNAAHSVTGVSEQLTADRTYYVRSDGNDSNTGLANTAGGAFLTIQQAFNTVAALNFGLYNVTIAIGAGTFTGGLLCGPVPGSGNLTIQGNGVGSTFINENVSVGAHFQVSGPIGGLKSGFNYVNFTGGFTMNASGAGHSVCFYAADHAAINVSCDVSFVGDATDHLFRVDMFSFLQVGFSNTITIGTNGCFRIVTGDSFSWIDFEPGTLTLTGTPNIDNSTDGSFDCDYHCQVVFAPGTVTGTATGKKFGLTHNSHIKVGTAMPGSIAGTCDNTSSQDGNVNDKTRTVSTPLLNHAQTWNSGTVAFTAWKLNVTATASSAGSLLQDLQVGSASKFSVYKDGTVKWAGNLQPLASMSTTMTDGFSNIVGANGAPSGTPSNTVGFPMYYDSTNNQIYVYNGAWKKTAALT